MNGEWNGDALFSALDNVCVQSVPLFLLKIQQDESIRHKEAFSDLIKSVC